ncbi:MAG: hypothetical protein IRZ11_08395, partial [Clostridia bacterium]|nr:hypothetical protein [Clostridia bacterium]
MARRTMDMRVRARRLGPLLAAWGFVLAASTGLSGCSTGFLAVRAGLHAAEPAASGSPPSPSESERSEGVVYVNDEYGFRFALPASWAGYRIVADTWQGLAIGSETVVASGPVVVIRHPDWTEADPRQDIPIMV